MDRHIILIIIIIVLIPVLGWIIGLFMKKSKLHNYKEGEGPLLKKDVAPKEEDFQEDEEPSLSVPKNKAEFQEKSSLEILIGDKSDLPKSSEIKVPEENDDLPTSSPISIPEISMYSDSEENDNSQTKSSMDGVIIGCDISPIGRSENAIDFSPITAPKENGDFQTKNSEIRVPQENDIVLNSSGDFNRKEKINIGGEYSGQIGGTEKKADIPEQHDDVSLGLSIPAAVVPYQNFTIRFTAYLEQKEQEIKDLLSDLSPDYKNLMNLDYCKWKKDTEITVRVYSTFLKVEPEIQKFQWVGKNKILNFDAIVSENAPIGKYIDVKVDVLIADIVIARLRSSLKIDIEGSNTTNEVTGKPYNTAFASYARKDSNDVIGRLSEIERNGVKIYWDRLSLHLGKKWQPQLDKAIMDSQIFLLFWSSNAKSSKMVEWEWQTALKYKGLDGIEPHPLEDPKSAPPPDELKALHFDDKYLYFRNRTRE